MVNLQFNKITVVSFSYDILSSYNNLLCRGAYHTAFNQIQRWHILVDTENFFNLYGINSPVVFMEWRCSSCLGVGYMIKIDNLTLRGHELEPKTRTIKIYYLISFKLNSEKNKIQYKPMKKNLSINDDFQYL